MKAWFSECIYNTAKFEEFNLRNVYDIAKKIVEALY